MVLELLKIKLSVYKKQKIFNLPLVYVVPVLYLLTLVGLCLFVEPLVHRMMDRNSSFLIQLIPIGLVSVSIILLMGGVMGTYRLFYESELTQLLTTPILSRDIVIAKLLELNSPLATLLALLLFPFVFSIGSATGAPVWYYPLCCMILLAYSFSISNISLFLTVLIMRLIPSGYRKEALTIFSGFFSLLVYIVIREFNLINQSSAILNVFPPIRLITNLWMGWAQGTFKTEASTLLELCTMLILITLLILLVLKRAFDQGWFLAGETQPLFQERKRKRKVPPLPFLPIELQAIYEKDLLYLMRNPSEWGALLYPIVVYLLASFTFVAKSHDPDAAKFAFAVGLSITSPIVCGILALNSTGKEKESFLLFRVSSISVRTLLWGKFWMIFMITNPPFLLAFVSIGVWFKLPVLIIAWFSIFLILVNVLATTLGLGYGYLFANFQSPIERTLKAHPIGVILFVVNFLIVSCILLVACVTFLLPFMNHEALQDLPIFIQQHVDGLRIIASIVFVILFAASLLLPFRFVEKWRPL